MNLSQLSQKQKLLVGFYTILVLIFGGIVYYSYVTSNGYHAAETGVQAENKATLSYCSQGDSATACDPPKNAYSQTASSNVVTTSIQVQATSIPAPTPTATPVVTPTPVITPTSTPAAASVIPLSFSKMTINPSSSGVAFTLTMNLRATGQIFYGTDPSNLTQSTPISSTAIYPRATINGLTSSTVYYYKYVAKTSEGQSMESKGSFKTRSNNPDIIDVGIDVAKDRASLSATANVAVAGQIFYGTDPNNLTQSTPATTRTFKPYVTLTNLTPNTTYFYRYVETDANNKTIELTGSILTLQ